MVWETLSEALARLLTGGLSRPDAQALICHAVVERKVRYRWRTFTDDDVLSRVPPETAAHLRDGLKENPEVWRPHVEQFYPRQSMGYELDFGSPPNPDDFDWRESRFKERWNFGSDMAPRWSFVWIDVLSTEITHLLSDNEWLQKSKLRADTDRRVQKVRKRRAERISRFRQDQRRRREWINFAEIAEWCSELDGSVISSEEAKRSAYQKLLNDLLAGEFDDNGRSRVLFLHHLTSMAKMTSSRARDFANMFSPETLRSEYLDHCWIPRSLFRRWLATHNLPIEPLRFEPMPDGSRAPRQKTEGKRGRRGPAPGTLDRYRAADQALYPELERIMRGHHKSAYAAALELAEANKVKGVGTANSRAKRLAGRFNEERGGKQTR